jgi:hypothetical protein
MEQSCGSRLGFGNVRLYPLPGCSGILKPSSRATSGDHEPPAITISSAVNSPCDVFAATI